MSHSHRFTPSIAGDAGSPLPKLCQLSGSLPLSKKLWEKLSAIIFFSSSTDHHPLSFRPVASTASHPLPHFIIIIVGEASVTTPPSSDCGLVSGVHDSLLLFNSTPDSSSPPSVTTSYRYPPSVVIKREESKSQEESLSFEESESDFVRPRRKENCSTRIMARSKAVMQNKWMIISCMISS